LLFQSPEFALLFAVAAIAFYAVSGRFRLHVLAASSLGFYAASGVLDFFLLLVTLGVTYAISLRIRENGAKWPIYVGIGLLLTSLAYLKYDDFIYQNLQSAFGSQLFAERPGYLSTILPLGISFYTFQIIGYLVDLHKGRTERAQSLLEYTVFVTFFAQLIAGPIMRAKDYLPQLRTLKGGTYEDFKIGGLQVLQGLIKKVVIADLIASRVDLRFGAESFSQPEAWIAAALFAFQIYFDFSGYVDIALGLARMLGIKLSQNFRTPYLSGNPSEFWSRWHITLSNWFRDYLYIPLGGNRQGRSREIFNVVVVMAVAGLWHGAGWTFVMWGTIHGVYLAVHRFVPSETFRGLMPVPENFRTTTYKFVGIGVFFALTVLAWIPFRAPDLATALDMYQAAFTPAGIGEWIANAKWLVVIGALFTLHVAEWWINHRPKSTLTVWGKIPTPIRGTAYAGSLVLVLAFMSEQQTFIYFRF
jgi:alginate O-acetyltransferase complex protein AlgI